jgi:hypothetical protein
MPSKRQVLVMGLPLLALTSVGAVLLAAGGPGWPTVAGLALVGVAGVGAVSAVFYAVGLSEDRERAEQERDREAPGSGPAAHSGGLVRKPFTRRRDHGAN